MKTILIVFTIFIVLSCANEKQAEMHEPKQLQKSSVAEVNKRTVRIENTFPHDTSAFTQGLVVRNGFFYETTGRNGMSSIRKVEIATGKVLKKEALEAQYFGEGMTVLRGSAYMLTWMNQAGLIYDINTLKQTGRFAYSGEGWGLTTDGKQLFKSNGSNIISVHNPENFQFVRNINVTFNGQPLTNINEMEWIKGKIWANIWQTPQIVVINPTNGIVEEILDLSALQGEIVFAENTDVLNGIAYDDEKDIVYVTGKCWPKVFQVSFE